MALRFILFSLLIMGGLPSSSFAQLSTQKTLDIYRYHGLKPAIGQASKDGIFQDFKLQSDNLAKIWADPDAEQHEGLDNSWVKSFIDRQGTLPHLSIQFSREGYGANISIAPKRLIPERLPKQSLLTFEARSSDPVCIGLRLMERDGEVWGYGNPGLEYQPLCVSSNQEWTTFKAPLSAQHPGWFHFPHSGNVDLGNQTLDADILALVTLELGLKGDGHLIPGQAVLDIRNIRVQPDSP